MSRGRPWDNPIAVCIVTRDRIKRIHAICSVLGDILGFGRLDYRLRENDNVFIQEITGRIRDK
jgi:hypothetical protein